MKILPTEFDGQSIRRVYDEDTQTWWFSVIDVVQVLTQQADDLTARKYWNQLKRRLDKEGSQLVTTCHQLKMPAADGKQRLTDVATAESLLRLVQSIPSPKAEPIKLWLAKVGFDRMQEMADPALSLDRRERQGPQTGEGPDQPQPARPHDRGRADLYRAGRTLHPPDCRNDGCHRHGRQHNCCQSRWPHCPPGPQAA